MACRPPGTKPFSEPMMVSLCQVTQPQWVYVIRGLYGACQQNISPHRSCHTYIAQACKGILCMCMDTRDYEYGCTYAMYAWIVTPSVNSSPPSAAYMHQWIGSALVQIMACRLFGAKPLSKPMLGVLLIGPLGKNFHEISIKLQNFSFTKMHGKITSAKWWPFCLGVYELTPLCPRPTVANVVCEPIRIGIRCASHSTVLIRITSY